MPAIAPGSAMRMMNGSDQDWKFTAITRYTSTTAKIMPSPRRVNEVLIVSTCPRRSIVVPRGSVGRTLSITRLTSAAKRPRSRWSGAAYTSITGCTS